MSFFIVAIFVLFMFGQKPPKLEDRVAALETKVSTLEGKVAALETWKNAQKALGAPAYDSDWKPIAKNQSLTLSHNLGGNPDNYVVDLQFKGSQGIHHVLYGGESGRSEGVFWRHLDGTRIIVSRWPNDGYTDQIRVRIWKY